MHNTLNKKTKTVFMIPHQKSLIFAIIKIRFPDFSCVPCEKFVSFLLISS